jgi:lipoprotein-anchoring transpeptidase ErfK/SrfK
MTIRTRPSSRAAVAGTLPAGSKYYGVPITAWVETTARHGRWGRVEIPYVWPRRDGWIPLRGLAHSTTHVEVEVDLSRHWVNVTKFGRTVFGLRAATGSAVSPTPAGEYFVTDRIPFSVGSSLGSFAFGISGIQPHLPPGWSGGNQLAIHGTNDPSSIGTSASAGCMRVSERGLHRLMPLLRLGTPVIVHR